MMGFPMIFQRSLLALCLFGAMGMTMQHAQAEQQPKVLGNDARVQYFDYDPQTVYLVKTKIGYSSLIQLEEGEEIDDTSGLGMGDANAWSLAVKGRNIFFKPLTDNADTNIVLVTNRRTYAFQLKNISNEIEQPTFIGRFVYPEEKVDKKSSQEFSKPTMVSSVWKDTNGNELYIDADINTSYKYRGNKTLKPTNTWDNGRFTYLKFAHAGDLPTVYRLLSDKSEVLVNSHVEGDTLVVHEVGNTYRLRFGDAVGEVRNDKNVIPKFNVNGTDSKNFVRVEQGQGAN